MHKTIAPIVILAIPAIFSPTLFAAVPIEAEWLKDDKTPQGENMV